MGITPLHCYYGPGRHRLACRRLPGCAGYTTTLLHRFLDGAEDGFSSCSACSCHRAVPNHPAGVSRRISQLASRHVAFT
jgi:hypothetical protein